MSEPLDESVSPRRAARERARQAASTGDAPAVEAPGGSGPDPEPVSKTQLGVARHGRLPKHGPVGFLAKSVAAGVAIVLVAGVSVGAIAAQQLKAELGPGVALQGEETSAAQIQKAQGSGLTAYKGGFNMLIVGTDNDADQSKSEFGRRNGTLNDVNILLHVSADHTNATAISIPRDMVVPIPSCQREDGSGYYSAMSAQAMNNAYQYGGLNCVVQTVKQLTGLDIPFAGLVSFNGVIEMTNAIGGVPVCVNAPIHDRYTHLNLPAGTSVLEGQDALAFLRSRHGVGDGSDLGRISSQQVYLSSMLRTLKSADTLGSPTKLFKLATAAAKNMKLSNSLNNVTTLTQLGLALKELPLANVNFVQYPGSTGGTGVYEGKVQPNVYVAGLLMDAVRADKPFSIPEGSTGVGSESATDAGSAGTSTPATSTPAAPAPATSAPAASAPAAPSTSAPAASAPATSAPTEIDGLQGQTAADETCSVAYKF